MQNRQVRQQYSKRKKEEAAGRNRGRVDEFQGRRHPEERLLHSVTGQGACRPMASILLNRQRGHSAPLMPCPSERPHFSAPCRSVDPDAVQSAAARRASPGGDFKARRHVYGDLFRSALCKPNRELPFYKRGGTVTKSALPAQTDPFVALPPLARIVRTRLSTTSLPCCGRRSFGLFVSGGAS